MAETRSQPPLNFVLTNETREILLSQLVKLKETYEVGFAQIREELHGLRLSLRSRNRKEENPEDQPLNDEELVETEVATEPIETEHGSEANANRISANLEEEPISPLQVPVSQLEPSLRFHNASPDVCEDFKSLVRIDGLFDHAKARAVLLKKSAGVTNNQAAHYLFDKMSLRVQSKRRQIKCHKSWRFKFKERKQRRGKLRSAHKLIHRVDVMEDDHVYQEGLPLWLLVRFRFWKFKFINRKLQKVMRDQGILQSRTGWVQEVSDVIRFLLRRHLHLNLVCEEPELAGRKRNHGLFIRLLNKLKQQRCPKSWMFKFKKDSKPARTNHILHQEKKPNEFEQVVKHTPFSVVKLGKPKDHDALLLLLSGDESFQIKHKWRFKLLPLILEWELYSDCLVLITNYAQQLDISRLMILMSVGWFTNLRSQLLFTTLKWSIQ